MKNVSVESNQSLISNTEQVFMFSMRDKISSKSIDCRYYSIYRLMMLEKWAAEIYQKHVKREYFLSFFSQIIKWNNIKCFQHWCVCPFCLFFICGTDEAHRWKMVDGSFMSMQYIYSLEDLSINSMSCRYIEHTGVIDMYLKTQTQRRHFET